MPLVFKLATFLSPHAHWLGWCDTFEGLDAGHFVTAHDMATQGVQQRCIGVECTDGLDLLGEGERVNRLGLGVQPVAGTMRLELGLLLKSDRLNAANWPRQACA